MEINILQTASTEGFLGQTYQAEIKTSDKLYIPNITSTDLNDLSSKEYNLRFPLKIIIIQEDGKYYIAQHPFLGVWAESKDISRAKRSLKQKIVRLYKKLKDLPKNQLGPFPEECLIYLENHIS
ncbi:MAG: hypothetical protein Q7R95_11005 [bacterium]|nr:hypothetical protein [bacterium]